MPQPLTDAINALTTYANTVTGASDTTLSDAVATLASGYGGGGYSLADVAGSTLPDGAVDLTGIKTGWYGLAGRPMTSVKGVLASGSRISGLCYKCSSLVTANISLSDDVPNEGNGSFQDCTALETLVFICTGKLNILNMCNGSNHLKTADLTVNKLRSNFFWNCSLLDTLILRSTTITSCESVSMFNQSKFKNGGTGGTIYIPKSLYDHLGDGTSDDYKSASNWSTLNGYGTVTWAKIEGSQYENYYADGTPIE